MTNGAGTMKTPAWIGAVTAACVVMGLAAAPASADELRIGMLAPMTGPFAQVGKDMVNGFEMYLEQAKGAFTGATVKFIVEDDQAKPPVGVLKAEKLIRQDQVHMFVGGVLASTGYAFAPSFCFGREARGGVQEVVGGGGGKNQQKNMPATRHHRLWSVHPDHQT